MKSDINSTAITARGRIENVTAITSSNTLYSCVAMDPPWPENGGGKSKRGADRHYETVPVKKLPKLIRDSGVFTPAASAHLWMWATKNYLGGAIWLMGQLGFRYVTEFVWVKLRTKPVPVGCGEHEVLVDAATVAREALQAGLGQYGRGAHELLLLGTRGDAMVPAPENRLPDVFFAERTEHSVKPAGAYEIIECVSPGPRLEMFARATRRLGRVGQRGRLLMELIEIRDRLAASGPGK